jgi:putative transcriptional regulator
MTSESSAHIATENGKTLTNHLLVAMPGLADPWFSHSVTYICEHSDAGCMGVVINKPLDLKVHDLLEHLDINSKHLLNDKPLLSGGPVQPESGLILHDGGSRWDNTLKVGDELYLTSSMDVLEALGSGAGPDNSLVILGYAGWAPGQLEAELAENAWLTTPATRDIIFHTPAEDCVRKAMDQLGIDPASLATDPGHA